MKPDLKMQTVALDTIEDKVQPFTTAITHTDDDDILWIKAWDAVAAARGEQA